MKKIIRIFGLMAFLIICGLMYTGCASLDRIFNAVSIRTYNNLTTVRAGGTLACNATGRNIVWTVSSTSDGLGPVSEGTFINSYGVLTVAAGETLKSFYVIARSEHNGLTDYKNIRIVSVSGVTVSSTEQYAVIGRTLQCRASVSGTNNPDQAVSWGVSSNADGSGAVTPGTGINANGLLSVATNEKLSTLYVTAISIVDTSKSGKAPVTVVIPVVSNVSVTSQYQSVAAGGTLQFSATVTGTYNPDNAVTWRVSSNAAGTGAVTPGTAINSGGVLTVAARETVTTLYAIATSAVDTKKSGSAAVTVIIPTVSGVAVSPSNQTITSGGSLQFSAAVTGTNNPSAAVTWRVSSNAAGTGAVTAGTSISAGGVLTVAANETAKSLYVFAVSAFDPSKSGSVIVSVKAAAPAVTGVSVNPTGQTINAGGSLQFSAAVTCTNNPSTAVTWRVSSNAAGTGAVTAGTSINAGGVLTVAANETVTTLYIFATSAADTTKTGSARVTIINNNANQGN